MNGWFDNLFGDSPDSVGQRLLTAYYNEAAQFAEFTYPSYDAWISYLLSRDSTFVTGLGDLVLGNYANTSVDQAESRLIDLANRTKGTASMPQIVQTAGYAAGNVNWSAGLPEIAYNTGADLAEEGVNLAANVGTGVLGTLNLVKYLPWIVLGAGAIYVFTNAKGLSKIAEKFK